MDRILLVFILFPLAAFLLLNGVKKTRERAIFIVALLACSFQLAATILITVRWLIGESNFFFFESPVFYKRGNTTFSFDLLFDYRTMVYAWIAGILGLLTSIFSRSYMHRDPGFRRFYIVIMLFFLGLNMVIFSGNFEVLFMGWEILGITSFLLIGFYRERYLPVKNALKVVSLYRIADVCLLVAVWMCHSVFERNINFADLSNAAILRDIQGSAGLLSFLIPFIFLIAAAVKSSQFPFSSWLPRAMEGPTTSSAIFYGSLSVHIGLFLMMRLSPFWIHNDVIRLLMAAMGLTTALIASAIASVQSSIKTQIAYASVVQIGIMFIELAAGFEKLALFHFAGNALLRTYQLLVSPSVLKYMIHDQFYTFEKPKDHISNSFIGRLRSSIFILSIKEWNLDTFHFKYLWSPFKWIGKKLDFLSARSAYIGLALLFAVGTITIFINPSYLNLNLHHYTFSIFFSVIGLMLILHAFAERAYARRAWLFLVASQLFIVLSVGFNEQLAVTEVLLYFSGIVVAAITGFVTLHKLRGREKELSLESYLGHIYEYPGLGLIFFLSCLGLVGFPLTPSFIGIDLVLTHVHQGQHLLILILVLSFIFLEIAALRVFSRIFLGPHVKAYHDIAFKNS